MSNPSIETLKTSDAFQLIYKLKHSEIKEILKKEFSYRYWLTQSYAIYQITMILLAFVVFGYTLALAIGKSNTEPLLYFLGGLMFSFTLLIIVHELLHGIAYKIVGVSKVTYGAYFRKFMFYAEADRFVLNGKQFKIVALAPFLVVKTICLIGIILYYPHGISYSVIAIMSAHSMFCAGDIGMLSIFLRQDAKDVYTFDIKENKETFYYRTVE